MNFGVVSAMPKYIVLDERDPLAPVLYNRDSPIYSDRGAAENDTRRLRRRERSRDIQVYELAGPGILYVLSEEDVFQVARDNRISKKKISERMDRITKGIENGFHDWYDIVETAIHLALDDR